MRTDKMRVVQAIQAAPAVIQDHLLVVILPSTSLAFVGIICTDNIIIYILFADSDSDSSSSDGSDAGKSS